MGGKLKISELERKAQDLRNDVIYMLEAAGSGHTAGSLDLAEILTATCLRSNPACNQARV